MHRLIRVGVAVALLVGVLWSGGVAEAAPPTTVTWKVSSLNKGQKTSLSALVSTNSPGKKTWSKSGLCTLTPTKKPTTLTMGATGSCTLTLKIAKSGKYVAGTSKKTITRTTVAQTTATTVTSSTRPSAPWTGQTIYQTDTNSFYSWNGTNWVIAKPTTGQTIYATDTNRLHVWNGTRWVVSNSSATTTTVAPTTATTVAPATAALVAPTTATTVAPTTTTTVAPTTATTVAPTTATTTTTIAPPVAPAFSLSSSSESKAQNSAIDGYTITSTGGRIASYSISPAAPTGTLFSTSTGLLMH